jgi:hypothetical protein
MGAQSRGADVRSARSPVPYTLCAMPGHVPALVAYGCAMIFRSSRRYVKLPNTSQVAWSSTPMGIDRSNLSLRIVMILFVFLGASTAARSATLEDSARELARKVTAALPAGDHVSMEIRNISSLAAEDVSVVEQTLTNELRDQDVRPPLDRKDAVHVRVTLSESIKSFLWVAEIDHGGMHQVLLLAVPRPAGDRIVSSALPMTLRSEKFWEGSQRILDAILTKASSGDPLLLVLAQDGIQIRNIGSDKVSIIPIPLDPSVTRDSAGGLERTDDGITFRSASQVCLIDTDARALIECHPEGVPSTGRVFQKMEGGMPGTPQVDRGSQITAVESSCRAGELYLAAGTGDYTESDTIGLFESTVVNGIAAEKRLSDFLHFPGPVVALQFAKFAPRAIVRNLQTGNYEAYRISVTCGG